MQEKKERKHGNVKINMKSESEGRNKRKGEEGGKDKDSERQDIPGETEPGEVIEREKWKGNKKEKKDEVRRGG